MTCTILGRPLVEFDTKEGELCLSHLFRIIVEISSYLFETASPTLNLEYVPVDRPFSLGIAV